jgi:hypothetical protein
MGKSSVLLVKYAPYNTSIALILRAAVCVSDANELNGSLEEPLRIVGKYSLIRYVSGAENAIIG